MSERTSSGDGAGQQRAGVVILPFLHGPLVAVLGGRVAPPSHPQSQEAT
ncbi:MAG TPA: hypothetical protein VGR26_15195 [Acidimicrobiales bacterium]|nr:hypothetical protein [Acidimicrobiales bacterium]